MALLTTCNYCGKRIQMYSKCDCGIGKEEKKAQRKQVNKRYDEYVRKSERELPFYDFYHSNQWQSLRNEMRVFYLGMCVNCWLRENRISTDIVIHHIEPIKKKWDKRFLKSNLLALCSACHNNTDIHDDEFLGMELRNEWITKYVD